MTVRSAALDADVHPHARATQRYFAPFKPTVALAMESVGVVTPE